jgi:hypothetical protein
MTLKVLATNLFMLGLSPSVELHFSVVKCLQTGQGFSLPQIAIQETL